MTLRYSSNCNKETIMLKTQAKTIVDIDTRRKVFMAAKGRKPADVAKVPHEAYIRNMLKDSLGWPRREPAPDMVKAVAKEMAAQFVARDKAVAEAMKAEEQAE